MKQLLVTKRERMMSRDARARSHDEIRHIAQEFRGKVIGVPGFSTRIAVPPSEAKGLRATLEQSNFIVEDDYALETFGFSRQLRAAAQNRRG